MALKKYFRNHYFVWIALSFFYCLESQCEERILLGQNIGVTTYNELDGGFAGLPEGRRQVFAYAGGQVVVIRRSRGIEQRNLPDSSPTVYWCPPAPAEERAGSCYSVPGSWEAHASDPDPRSYRRSKNERGQFCFRTDTNPEGLSTGGDCLWFQNIRGIRIRCRTNNNPENMRSIPPRPPRNARFFTASQTRFLQSDDHRYQLETENRNIKRYMTLTRVFFSDQSQELRALFYESHHNGPVNLIKQIPIEAEGLIRDFNGSVTKESLLSAIREKQSETRIRDWNLRNYVMSLSANDLQQIPVNNQILRVTGATPMRNPCEEPVSGSTQSSEGSEAEQAEAEQAIVQ